MTVSRSWCESLNVPFYRFSPELKKDVKLDENRDDVLIEMLWETEYYMTVDCAEDVDDLVKFIRKLFSC